VASVIQDWSRYVADIYRVTAPSGRIQLTELSFRFVSQKGQLPKDSGLKVMERALRKYAAFNHYNLEVESNLATLVRDAGFHGVEEKEFIVPVGNWNTGIPLVLLASTDVSRSPSFPSGGVDVRALCRGCW
jgi:hypothetical protein